MTLLFQVGSYPYPLKQRILGEKGHLSNELSGRLLGEVLHDHFGTVFLGHLSKENNYAELAYETVRLEVTMGDNPYKGDVCGKERRAVRAGAVLRAKERGGMRF